jgi:RNA polymerase sigma-70 factor (ECF subfamily)
MNRNSPRFTTTRWTLVLTAGDRTSAESQASLATLCETYWYPVYAFIRRSGRDSDAARDLTQAFFVRVLDKNVLKEARRDRGRFRSFLLGSLRHFLANEYDREHAVKRGGRVPHLSLEFEQGERRYQLEPADTATPERMYERQWALDVLDRAMQRLAARHAHTARQALFEQLKPLLTGDDEPLSSRELSKTLGLSEGALRVALHRLRRQFAEALRGTIADTVEHETDIDDEVRYLLNVVRR